MNKFFLAASLTILAGCAHQANIPLSEGHISQPKEMPKSSEIPPLVTVPTYVPAPKPTAKPQTYSVVVNEVPAKELLFALARDTKVNVDIHPGIQGLVTLNAINETLPAILDRVSKQVSIRYKLEGNTLIVTPDTPYIKTYRIDYVNIDRSTDSSIGVSTQVATTGSAIAAGGAASSQSGASGNNSNLIVKTQSKNNFWEILGENIRHILSATKSANQSAEEKALRQETARASREERLQQAEAVARAGSGATTLFATAFGNQSNTTPGESRDDAIINPVAGTVTVFGTERQQELIAQFLNSTQNAIQRQVLIEATIVEVSLNDQYRTGVDWSRVASGTGFTFKTNLGGKSNLANTLSSFLTGTYSNKSSGFGVTIDMLESFGKTRVLSSPKIMALNNQTALLKVVNNTVYFTVDVQQGSTSSTTGLVVQPTYTSTPHTVPVGIVLSVTPQINENDVVSLTVRPTISRITGFKDDPNPALGSGSSRIPNQVPEIQVREMESVLQISSGQTVILGGLMQDDISRNRDGIPELSRLDGIGSLFGQREEKTSQTELVIFLRPTVITNPTLESDELKFYQRFLPGQRAVGTNP
ncbi:pilus (MSHA type) biogenesis protein MshL [Sulfurirhabdus autotrophica]|uniref:General secretion pathway protein D n=1 Tax=Sulfurirhabdus autotrophica TaxID=1706046 RepID=A0A4R3XTQ4_9PROT|nr:pilus (MSHA type) biogenesis protein MshL [Sulfurirhabdus autotrophica]TCV80068.1 general secretion pathway protein D [Sulfurirhabdus autotrophica]